MLDSPPDVDATVWTGVVTRWTTGIGCPHERSREHVAAPVGPLGTTDWDSTIPR